MASEELKKDNKDEKERSASLSAWFSGIKGEFKRIAWPNRTEAAKMTVVVIVTSAIVGAIIAGYDFILSTLYNLMITVLG